MGARTKPPPATAGCGVLGPDQLRGLARHRYRAPEGQSLTDPYLEPLWRWVTEQAPAWWAPNTLILVGLIVNGATTFLLMVFCGDATGQAPSWCYCLCAGGLATCLSLNAIARKLAVRSDCNNPLGELFDHGCNALSVVFVIVGACMVVELGSVPWLLFSECFATMFVYYAAHWQTYCSGVRHINMFDVTEAQLLVILMHFSTCLFGTSLWNTEILSTGIPLMSIPVGISAIAGLVVCTNYFHVILMRGGVGKNGSTVAGTSVLSPVFPIGILIVCAYYFWKNSVNSIFEHHPVLFVMTYGMSACKLSIKLVISYMSCSEMDLCDSSFSGPVLVLLNQYFSIIGDYHALWFCILFCTFDLINYSVRVCSAICDRMDIHCFRIERPFPKAVSASAIRSVESIHGTCTNQRHIHSDTSHHNRSNTAQTMNCYSNTSYVSSSSRLRRN